MPPAAADATLALASKPGHSLRLKWSQRHGKTQVYVRLFDGSRAGVTTWLSLDPDERIEQICTKYDIGADELLPHFLKSLLSGEETNLDRNSPRYAQRPLFAAPPRSTTR
jgi:hypothetical protein